MSDVSREYEAAALRAFRDGVPAPLLALPADALERVMPLMTEAELMLFGSLRRRSCRHVTTTREFSVPGMDFVVHTLRCGDCGERFKRLEASGDVVLENASASPSFGSSAPHSRAIARPPGFGSLISAAQQQDGPPFSSLDHDLMNILLVDDHKMIRDGLRAVLEREGDLHVTGEAADGRTAVELCATLRPDVVVMDIGMPNLNGTEATRQVAANYAHTRVVALSMNHDRRYVREMFAAGASAYCVKSSAGDELIRAIRAVARNEKYVSPAVAGAVLDAFVEPASQVREPRTELSPREREVLQLVAEGLTSKEVACRLDLAVSTIESHRKQIMSKLELRSVAELTKYAIRSGLTTLGA